MRSLTRRFDQWVNSGPFATADVAIYRLIFGALALLTYPRLQQLSDYPEALFRPPPGPFSLLPTLPSPTVLGALEAATVVALASMMVGFFTRTSSVAAGLLLLASFGLTYSFGKIDHTILLAAVPLSLAWCGWGDDLSLDAARRRGRPAPARAAQWPIRMLALLVGLGFVSAALPKLVTGWLEPSTQATQGHFLIKYIFEHKESWLAPLAYGVASPALWEPLDWITVALELLLIVSVLSWRWFRIAIAAATLFHVGVVLIFNISFNVNVVAYGAFVAWSALVSSGWRSRIAGWRATSWAAIGVLSIVAALVLSWMLGSSGRLPITTGIVFVGGAIAVAFLTQELAALVRAQAGSRKASPR